jgi:metallo-beta-lactamase family protein
MATLGFYGGVGSVTGANFMLDVGEAAFLVDCGLIQGDRFTMAQNGEPFVYRPADADVLVVTHAHADHIGRIPKLLKDGFVGTIYSTPPTRDLAEVMLRDAYKVMLYEEERYGIDRIYDEHDIVAAFDRWQTIPYDTPRELPGGVTLRFTDAGHILGSAMAHFTRGERTIVFTGDIGNVPQPLLNPPVVPEGYHYLVMESVYGDRTHEEVDERTELLRGYIEETRRTGGTLIIPAFSLERTQGMLFEINNLIEREGMEPIPVFLDSPLAISVTEIYRRYPEYLSDAVRAQIAAGDDIFSFDGLSFTRTVADSREIAKVAGAKIIIAGSGMSHGGRILEHEQRYLEDPKTTLLLVGYQAVGSLGRKLHDGVKKVRILDVDVKVRAKIARIRGYSGHADRPQLIDLVANGAGRAEKVFVAMGEEKSSLHLVQRLRDYLGLEAIAPAENQEFTIDF